MEKIIRQSTPENIVQNFYKIFEDPKFLYHLMNLLLNDPVDAKEVQAELLKSLLENAKFKEFLRKKTAYISTNPDSEINPEGILNNKKLKSSFLPHYSERQKLNQALLHSIASSQENSTPYLPTHLNSAYDLYQDIFSKPDEIHYSTTQDTEASQRLFNVFLEAFQSRGTVTVYTLFCPDYSYEFIDSSKFRFTFQGLNSDIGIIAERGLTMLQNTCQHIASSGIPIDLHANYVSFECPPDGYNLNSETHIPFEVFESKLQGSSQALQSRFQLSHENLTSRFATSELDPTLPSSHEFHRDLKSNCIPEIDESIIDKIIDSRGQIYDKRLGKNRSLQETQDYIRGELKMYIYAQEIHKALSPTTVLLTSDNPILNLAAAKYSKSPLINGYSKKALY